MYISEKYLNQVLESVSGKVVIGVKRVGAIAGKKLLDVAGTVIGIVAATTLITKRKEKGCNRLDKPETQKAYWKCRGTANRKAISRLRSKKLGCNNTKDPEKCRGKIDIVISKYEAKVIEAKENAALYE